MSLSQTSTSKILTHPPPVSATSTGTLSLSLISLLTTYYYLTSHIHMYIYIFFNLCILLVAYFLCQNISSMRAGIFFCVCNPYMWVSLVAQWYRIRLPCRRWGFDPWVRIRFPGEENGNPLLYSCLGNPMDRGARRATIHGFTRVRHDSKPPATLTCNGVPGPQHLLNKYTMCCKRKTVRTKLLSDWIVNGL